MRLTRKLTLALSVVLMIQFALYSYLGMRRLTGFFEHDVKGDALLIGQTLATAVSRTWKTQGEKEAVALVEVTNDDYQDMQIRFVWLGKEAVPAETPELPPEMLAPLRDGKFLVKHVYPEPDLDFIYTYVRIPGEEAAAGLGTLELKQSFATETCFAVVSQLRLAALLLVVVFSTAVLMWLLGVVLIGRPIKKLSDKARRIGEGDFSTPLELTGNDEIATLAHEINNMSEALQHSRERLEEEVRGRIAAMEQLRHVDRLTTIGTLASGVAHELGTPLTVVSGHLNILQTKVAGNPELEKINGALSEQVDKMAGIVRHLLDFSRRRTPEKSSNNLWDILGRVINMLTRFGEKRNVSIHLVPGSEDAEAPVDPTQIEQVLTNLVVNAIQATESGLIEVGIKSEQLVHPEKPGSSPALFRCIYVKDFGSGMSDEQVKQIFDPFYTTKASGQGTGMGLSIAAGIVREHEGWISVQTEVGKGSRFSVYLPAGRIA